MEKVTVKFVSTDYCKEPYCKFCGELIKDGHNKECPIINPKTLENLKGVMGLRTPENPIGKLAFFRLKILMTLTSDGKNWKFGPTNEDLHRRLVFEDLKFNLENFKGQLEYYDSDMKKLKEIKPNPIKKYFINKKLEKDKKEIERVNKAIENLRKLAENYIKAIRLDSQKVKELFGWHELMHS